MSYLAIFLGATEGQDFCFGVLKKIVEQVIESYAYYKSAFTQLVPQECFLDCLSALRKSEAAPPLLL